MVTVLACVLMPAQTMAWDDAGTFTVGTSIGVGTEAPARQMHIQGNNAVFRMDRDSDTAAFMVTRTAPGNFAQIYKTFVIGGNASGVNNGEFVINDLGASSGGPGTRRFTIATGGQTGIGDFYGSSPSAGLHIKNPASGDILRLDNASGNKLVSVGAYGDINAKGADIELRLTTATSGGYSFPSGEGLTTVLGNTSEGNAEEGFFAVNGDTAYICSPGNNGLLNIVYQDTYATNYTFYNSTLRLWGAGDHWIDAKGPGDSDDLFLMTTGEQIKFVSDSDADTDQTYAFSWYCNGTATTDKRMGLQAGSDGGLRVDGTVTENTSFDLAEAYWKSDTAIGAGDVVRIDPAAPNAVVLARKANDTAVVGVISTEPGIIMGGGAFSTNRLEALWGSEIVALFAKEQEQIQSALLAEDKDLQARVKKLGSFETFRPMNAGSKPEEVARAKEEFAQEQQQLAGDLEEGTIESFCKTHLAIVALAGRVPVKVDASYGAIQAGDLLVASGTPGHAMRANNPAPGTVIGKALESCAAGQKLIMMLVMNR